MKINTLMIDLEAGERITARLTGHGLLLIEVGGEVMVWVSHRKTPEVYAEMCRRFGLKNETAPGDQTGSGVPGGNEPAQEMVPQKVQV